MAIVYTNNFDAETLLTKPAGWVGTAAMLVRAANPVSGANAFGEPVGTGASGDIATWQGAGGSLADCSVSCTQVVAASAAVGGAGIGSYSTGLVFRANAANTNYYLVYPDYSSTTGGAGGLVYYVFSPGATSLGFTGFPSNYFNVSSPRNIALGDLITIKARMVGTVISVKAWLVGDAEPVAWMATLAADATLAGPGYAGLRNTSAANTVAVTADDFLLDNLIAANPVAAALHHFRKRRV